MKPKKKRTIKAAAGKSKITAAQARAAARSVQAHPGWVKCPHCGTRVPRLMKNGLCHICNDLDFA